LDVTKKVDLTKINRDIAKHLKPGIKPRDVVKININSKAIEQEISTMNRKKEIEVPKFIVNEPKLVIIEPKEMVPEEEIKIEERKISMSKQSAQNFLDNHLLGVPENISPLVFSISVNANSTSNISMMQENVPQLD
jgi:hypothetical protein